MNWEDCPDVDRVPAIHGGTWSFEGTGIPVYFLFRHIAAGGSIDTFQRIYGVDRSKIFGVLNYEADQLFRDRLNFAADRPADSKPVQTSRFQFFRTSLSNIGMWFAIFFALWPIGAALGIAVTAYTAVTQTGNEPVSNISHAKTDNQTMINEHTHEPYAALVALLVASILIVPAFKSETRPKLTRAFRGTRTFIIGTGTFVSAYLWTASDSGAEAWDPVLALLLGLIFLILAVMVAAIAFPVWGANQPDQRG